jgi:o-succinylbenzoate synthase
MKIEIIEAYKLELPLLKPYHTSQGDFPIYNSILIILRSNGREGVGESSPVIGYSWEGPNEVWRYVQEWGKEILGKDVEEARLFLESHIHSKPFTVTPMLTAIESMMGELNWPEAKTEFPLVGILNVIKKEHISDAVKKLLDDGYKTIKVKVGFDVEGDINRVRIAQSVLGNRGKIRIDANQGYNFDQALSFVRSLDPENIELFEQPFNVNDWRSMQRLAALSSFPLGLDESIYQEKDVEKATNPQCAHFIKLKLMKAGSIRRLIRLCELVGKKGFRLVLGNGIATDISCYQEVLIALKIGIDTAGEMNGFMKLKRPILPEAIFFEGGKAVLKPVRTLVPEKEVFKEYVRKEIIWEY